MRSRVNVNFHFLYQLTGIGTQANVNRAMVRPASTWAAASAAGQAARDNGRATAAVVFGSENNQ